MNMIGSNALAMLTQQAEETLANLATITEVNAGNCGDVKDMADYALKLSKDIEESRKLAKKPHQDAAEAVDNAYTPLRDRVSEKRKAEAAAAEARRKAEEAAKAAAEEDPFLADETAAIQAQEAVALAETRALAARQVTSAAGISKASSLRTVRSAVVKDAVALVTFYANHPDVLGAATKCANAAIRAAKGGPLTIPGVEIKEEEKLV
jgi:hypothetical protein